MALYNLNKVLLVGNLTRDPELSYTPGGTAISKFGLAVNRRFKSGDDYKEDTCFVNVVVFGRQAENCSEYLQKGSSIYVEGRLSYSTWEREGQRRSKLEVIGERIRFLSKGKSSASEEVMNNNELEEPLPPEKINNDDNDEMPF